MNICFYFINGELNIIVLFLSTATMELLDFWILMESGTTSTIAIILPAVVVRED